MCDSCRHDSDRPVWADMTVDQAAANGAALLDEKRPNWRTLVDPSILDMRRTNKCVIGQIFGIGEAAGTYDTFSEACRSIGVAKPDEFVKYGFDKTLFTPWSWDEMNEAWRKILA